MAGLIPKQFIDDLLARVDVVEVIDSRLPLKKAGSNYVACCPFHNEKTPSFTVSPDKQFYHCFGCGAHGTAISFVMEYENQSFPEAVETLAQSMGLEVPREGGHSTPVKTYEEVYAVLDKISQYYQKQLRQHQAAIDYLKARGLSGKIAADFAIGYAPAGWDNILQRFGQDEAQKKTLLQAGLIIEKDKDKGRYYDRFRNRIMFPIRDRRGRTIAFGGRILNPEDNPKYLNSPETVVFNKSQTLYAQYELRQQKANTDSLLVVEGYMDTVMLAQHDINNCVATLGTATTSDNLKNLFKLSQDIIFCFDGDRAGRQAAWRALETALTVLSDRHQVRFLFLPEGEDPDSQVNKIGKQAFLDNLAQALPLSEYLLDELKSQYDTLSLDGRAQLAEAAKPLIKRMQTSVLRELIIGKLADIVGLSADKLIPVGNENNIAAPHYADIPEQQTSAPTPRLRRANKRGSSLEMTDLRKAIAALLNKPALALSLEIDIATLKNYNSPGIPLLLELIALISEEPGITSQALLERYRDTPNSKVLARLASHDFHIDNEQPQQFQTIFTDSIQQILKKYHEQRFIELLQKLNNNPKQFTEKERQELQQYRRH